MISNAIQIEHVAKSFGATQALADVNLTVAQGETRALLGRNGAGKSTLIAALTGGIEPDAGRIQVIDESGVFTTAGDGSIGCVFQKSTLVPTLTAGENIFLGHYPTRFGFVDQAAMRDQAAAMLYEWGFERLSERLVSSLEPLEKKVVEICRALQGGPRVLLLDEPTAGLDAGASQQLFTKIEGARARGVTVIYVSHHLAEVFEVCDSVTVLRDGRDVATGGIEQFSFDSIVSAMAGPVDGADGPALRRSGQPVSGDRDRSSGQKVVITVNAVELDTHSRAVSLEVKKGERVGLTGLDGAGHITLARAIAGEVRVHQGTVEIDGKALRLGDVAQAIRSGVGSVPEDRHINGLVPDLSVEENATLTVLDRIRGPWGFVSRKRRRVLYSELSSSWAIKSADPTQAVSELSGGNQQKVVLARALASDPRALVLINPTAGVDVTAKESIYSSLIELSERGTSLLIASNDDDDLAVCDRVVVMYDGAVTAHLPAGYTEIELMTAVQGQAPLAPHEDLTRHRESERQ
ncbi:hypothetical protein B7R21_17340 [Subtercola boreus]|uniref:ABC transporter domain-containing protein n=1 Tax=Subtercola boreus TaxID=120213 RepID=A0A3E0VB61_9MICO|nr:sugar ABC transporter ATP-binding protein [Subtercola boreus]RFA06989.1 hypothetical protein B7R21_17340 [Subtercola boreus]